MSRLIKSQWTKPVEADKKVISIKVLESISEGHPEPIFSQTAAEKKAILDDARMEADMLIQQATVHAQGIREKIAEELAKWDEEKQAISEQARQEGFAKGMQEGRERGYSEYKETINFAKEIVTSSKNDYQLHVEASEKTILELGIKVAEKILGKTLKGDSQQFLSVVKRALKEARDHREIQLHIHPIHYGFLLSQKDELVAIFPKEIDFYIYPDDDLSENSCVIESVNGRIDASVDVQLEEIKLKLIESLESGS